MKVCMKLTQLFQYISLITKYQSRTFTVVWSASSGYLLLSILFTLIESSIPFGQIWIGKLIIDKVAAIVLVFSINEKPELHFLIFLLIMQFALWAIREACDAFSEPARALLAERVNHRMEMLLAAKAASVELLWYERPEFQNYLMNARRATSGSTLPIHNIFIFFREIISLILAISFLSRLHWIAPLIICILLAPDIISRVWFSHTGWKLKDKQTSARLMMNYLYDILVSRTDGKEVRIFGLKTFLLKRYSQLWNQIFQQDKKLIISQNIANAIVGSIAALGTASVYAYTIYKAVYQHITLGDLMLYFQITGQLQVHFKSLLIQISNVYEVSLEQMHFYRFMDLDINTNGENEEQIAPKSFNSELSRGIECKNVWFQYPGSDNWVLKDVSFTIYPGEKVAFVGENGAGKTTLTKLIAGLYKVTRGSICIDNQDAYGYKKENTHHMSAIFQDFSCYELTARENIGFGNVTHLLDTDLIISSAKKGGAAAIINGLPNMYETYLGRWFEQGISLSGGEWQKIALARAFMRDAKVLIMDEPTASLDALAESDLYEHINELTRGKTVIFISHRFSTVKMAERIFVLEKGKIAESGNHIELMQLGGIYAKMYQLQADRYTD